LNINKTHYSDKENNILIEISNYCNYNCLNKLKCLEEDCVLFRIEKIITNDLTPI
jgi:hypothetical protein